MRLVLLAFSVAATLMASSAQAGTYARNIVDDIKDTDVFFSDAEAKAIMNAMIRFGTPVMTDKKHRKVVISELACEGDRNFESDANCVVGQPNAYRGVGDVGTPAQHARSLQLIQTLTGVLSHYTIGQTPNLSGSKLTEMSLDEAVTSSAYQNTFISIAKLQCQTSLSVGTTFCKIKADRIEHPISQDEN